MSALLKPKHQRLVLALIALIAIIGAGVLAAWALRSQASYFYVPSQMVSQRPETGQAVRLGGMVKPGSLLMLDDGVSVRFVVSDGDAEIGVRYAGILPDLFTEGSGVVAEGALDAGGTFQATNLLAKHDENYVPRELEGMGKAQQSKNDVLLDPTQ